ncbi:Uu.00g070060.m01.CDS01 [Anthostomella pinea]|uniref:Uu.00g070060.m01.CDS01 n=1 Tax=Anthostomella pinea TaxID=933095 RepID=A0AAI8VP09_9PEZI|nr:Uu.00g070060.m01.CDS01 [Anthostomella pinea]
MADPLSVAGSAVGIISLGIQVTQSLFDYYTAVKSQHSDISYTAERLESLLELLELLRNHIQDRRFQADEEESIRKIESLIQECEECIQELQGEADKFKKTPVTTIQSAVKATARRAAYPFRRSTLEKLDEDITEVTDRLKLAIQVLQHKVIDRVQDDVRDIKALVELVRSSQLSSELQSWLKAPDATINFNEACKKKHPRTGLWLVHGNVFHDWLRTARSFLWLRGFAGCGKSVLCSTAIQYAFRHRRSHPRTGIAFFFFAFNDESKQDASALFRALILQLSMQLDNHNDLSRLHGSYRHASPPDEALLGCLHQLIKAFQDVYILVDALDESPRNKHREVILQVIKDMRRWKESGLHLLVTSRNEVDIREELEAKPKETIEMKNIEVDRDIAIFVAQNLQNNRRYRKWQQYSDRIEKALTERANGVFRWVECQFKALAACPANQHLLNRLLQSLPQSLDDTYARMLRNIAPELREYAQQMLTILCCAIRPLTDLELIDALAVELGDQPRFDITRRFEDVHDLEALCPGFIETSMDLEMQTTVRIAHFSVQEYLESERVLHYQDLALFHVRKPVAHIDMVTVCLALLLEPRTIELQDSRSIKKSYPLAEYAARYWPEHNANGTSRDKTERQILQLFQDTQDSFSNWVNIWNIDESHGELSYSRIPSSIYYASYLGLTGVLGELLNQKADVNAPGGRYGTALQAASSGGHKETVELLLSNGADINAQGGDYGTALQAASSGGHKETVELLLSNGANVNAQGGYYGTALQAASFRGHKEIVELLLSNGANVNAQGGYYGTALQAASSRGHKEIVELLLSNGADINAQGGDYGTALQAASSGGHKEIMELLLSNGADVNTQGGYYGTALQAASFRGHKEIVELLLSNGANVNAQGGYYGTALQAASSRGHKEIVELLLSNGADVNVLGGYYGTALQAASFRGHKEIVELLLSNGADVNTQGGDYGTALQAASSGGHKEIMELLLSNGADVNVLGGHYGTALQAASSGGHQERELRLK